MGRSAPSARPPAIQNTPLQPSQIAMRHRFIRIDVSDAGTARAEYTVRPSCIATKASAKASPLLSNAFGIEVESSSPAIIIANSISRVGVRSGSSQLVIQEV